MLIEKSSFSNLTTVIKGIQIWCKILGSSISHDTAETSFSHSTFDSIHEFIISSSSPPFHSVTGVRNPEGSRKSVESNLGELAKDKVFYETCDTGDMQSVRDFAKAVQTKFPEIHLLINNGG